MFISVCIIGLLLHLISAEIASLPISNNNIVIIGYLKRADAANIRSANSSALSDCVKQELDIEYNLALSVL